MIIAVASGKGGTGKTTVATNLALTLAEEGRKVAYFDCDVEEPNGHIFLQPKIMRRTSVGIPIPQVDMEKCTGCGLCGQICQYSAIVVIKKSVLTFPELCNGCGGCSLVCPVEAIKEVSRQIGVVEEGKANDIRVFQGILRVGEVRSTPLIRQVKRSFPSCDGIKIVDVAPGTSCPVIEAVKGADFVLLVTEPTPFGLNDLKLAVGMVRKLRIPSGVVINRVDVGDDEVKKHCQTEGIEILLEIPDDRRVAEAYSRGELAINAVPEYRSSFYRLGKSIEKSLGQRKEEKHNAHL